MAKEYRYYLPQAVPEFIAWARNFCALTTENAGAWGLNAGELAALGAVSSF